jgi:hypothetical protein
VAVDDLIGGTTDMAYATTVSVPHCGAAAGMERRAVFFGNDREHVFRFLRTNRNVTIVKGGAPFHQTVAERLVESMKPWNVECKIVAADEFSKPRELTEAQAKTWCGLDYAGSGQIKPGAANPLQWVGFALRDNAILLGTPDDNPMIKFLQAQHFLPYDPQKDVFPGVGRGMMAWQLDGVGYGQESITLIGYDAEGLAEAAGTMFEASIGWDPLTPWVQPATSSVTPATRAP